MKPNSQISRQPNQPLTDYAFHSRDLRTGAAAGSLKRPVFAPGFRNLSNEFLGAETKRNYVAEVLFFAIIVGVSAWPIVSMVQALAQLMK